MKASPIIIVAVAFAVATGLGGLISSLATRSELAEANKKIERMLDQIADLDYNAKQLQSAPKIEKPVVDDAAFENKLRSILHRLATLEGASGSQTTQPSVISTDEDKVVADALITKPAAGGGGIAARLKKRLRLLTMEQVTEELGLSEDQKPKLVAAIDRGRERIYELAEAAVHQDPEMKKKVKNVLNKKGPPRQKARRLIKKLKKESPPGQEGSYFDALKQIREETAAEITGILTPEQLAAAKEKRVNFMMLKTGFMKNKRAQKN